MDRGLTPFRIQKFLGGLRYPAPKPAVIDHARCRGADARVLDALAMLPERDFESPVEVSRRVGESAHRRAGAA
jgi:hypothetical protein